MSGENYRTNMYTADATSDRYHNVLFDWLAAQAPLWNQVNYRRQDEYYDDNGDVWDAEFDDLYDKYAPVIGKATAQQVVRKNSEAWRSHFRLLDKYHDDSDSTVTEKPDPPGFRGNRDDGYELLGCVRGDLFSIEWGETSTLEFGVGDVLEEKYDFDY